jgi:RNA polymerase sigma-70 factor, ECF subfamily
MFSKPSDQFVQLITRYQRDLYVYILMLLPLVSDAEEVLQQTSLVLWSKREEFRPELNFRAWASKIAYYEVLAFRRDKRRDRHCFGDALLNEMATEAVVEAGRSEAALRALALCSESLKPADRRLLDFRYTESLPVAEIAKKLGRTSLAVRQALFRIRTMLLRCIERRLSKEDCP